MEEGRLILPVRSRRRELHRAAVSGLMGLAVFAWGVSRPHAAKPGAPESPPVLVARSPVPPTSTLSPGAAPRGASATTQITRRKETSDPGHEDGSGGRPKLEAAGVSGIRKAIKKHRGAPLLVNFWAVWCEPCVDELPDLAGIETRFASSRIRVLGVSCDLLLEDDSPEIRRKVTTVLGAAKVAYPNLLYNGPSEGLMESFSLPGPIPHSILYAPDGSEMKRWTGKLRLGDLAEVLKAVPKGH